MVDMDLQHELASLAAQVSRLCPCHRDPHRFHADKSDIAARLRLLANGNAAAKKTQRHTASKDGKLKPQGPVRAMNLHLVRVCRVI